MTERPVSFPAVRPLLLATCLAVLVLLCAGFSGGRAEAAATAPPSYTTALFRLAHPAGLQKFARAVSTPGSGRYQRYKPVAWMVKRFGAKPKVKRRALRWLESRGMSATVDGSGQNLIVGLDRSQTERFLPPDASASSARHGSGGKVPAGLEGVVTGVSFLDTDPDKFETQGKYPPQPSGSPYPANSSARPHSGTQAGCAAGRRGAAAIPEGNQNFTPNQYLDAYGISRLHGKGLKGQGRRIAVIEIDGFKRSDIETYGKCYGKRVPPTRVHLVGPKKRLAPGAETTLDLEVISMVAPRLKAIDVYQGSGSEEGIMRMVGRALGGPRSKPAAISISLGGCEPNLFGQMQFRRGLDNIFAVAAGAGISVAVAAGDNGSAECSSNGNSTTLPQLSASDPASSTWVTAVGGTNFVLDAHNRIKQEFVWNDASIPAGGGGGLSILATQRPWYQQGTKFFNSIGLARALPDVVALADSAPGYSVYCTAPGAAGECVNQYWPEGGWQPVGGTSAATPLTASLLTLVSQRLAKAGRRPIGFANPLLYKLAKGRAYHSVFRDIVAGNNDVGPAIPAEAGGGQPLGCCGTHKKFDLSSGWGSIKAPGLAKAAMKVARHP